MRLACPNCDARYEVPDGAIPKGGRDVQCSSCGHAWFQLPEGAEPLVLAPEASLEASPELGPEVSPELGPEVGPEALPEGAALAGAAAFGAPDPLAAEGAAGDGAFAKDPAFGDENTEEQFANGAVPRAFPEALDGTTSDGDAVVMAQAASAMAVPPEERDPDAAADLGRPEAEPVPSRVIGIPDEAEAAAAIARALSAAGSRSDEDYHEDLELGENLLAPGAKVEIPKVELPSDVRSILREEAAIENDARRMAAQRVAARRADAEVQLQTQSELGLDEPGATAVQRRLAMLRADDEGGETPLVKPSRPAARRDLLPDVEEITSTLQPGDDSYDPNAAVDALPDLNRRRSFRSGFVFAVALILLAVGLYVSAESLRQMAPGLEPWLNSYVGFINEMRVWLDQAMERLTQMIRGSAA